jgi:vesicle transport through interaction with t-SNAREs 1
MNDEKEFLRLMSLCSSRLSSSSTDLGQIGSDLTSAETILRQLKTESIYLQINQRQEVMHRYVKYLSEINNLKKQLRDREQENLFGNKIEVKIQSNKSTLKKQINNLDIGKQISLESEAVATFTMEKLRNQRNQLNKANYGAKQIGENLAKSNKLINSLQRRAMTNKLLMISIILLLTVAIFMVGVLKIIE